MTDNHAQLTKGSGACRWAVRLAIASLALLVAGLAAGQLGVGPFVAMLTITAATLVAIIAGITGAIGLLRSGGSGAGSGVGLVWLAVILGVAGIANTAARMGAGGAPIHDISTDTADPPAFVAVAELRGPNDNPAEYAGPETAAQQAAAYPDLQTLVLADPYSLVFATALEVAERMGWEIVASDANAGRIEATATTPFVGFKDDVVIRIRDRSPQTLVDVRSKSRLGMGDMGVNAKRIRDYTGQLVAALEP
ncbi:MAG: DUF1499 domain-containing protein [Gammaproteobacteria bacterium]|jgi:hypothetical protein|nr:DUF1499 domain-containing protein [Gammaproteobacteria bacterium]